MALSTGEKLGPYEIFARIGKGGMGEVWKAHDPRLNRDVAIKVSAAQFSERFEREAKAIAALNHPHICSLYDVGPDYLVMEHVDGAPLEGPLPLDRVLLYGSQICDALEAAHRKGIIHRDLKPGNILVAENGVKVLDFGLAKIAPAPSPEGATETIPLTSEGSFMGTVPYMAPEQIEGKEVDARADIFALGVVLYELITGKRPFAGSSQPSLIASILKDQPRPLRELQPLTSHGLERVIETCLEKEPDKRWQSAREVKHALDWIAAEKPRTTIAAGKIGPWQGLAALFALIALGLAVWMVWFKTQPSAQVSRFQAVLPENVTFEPYLSVSPDGRKLVFAASRKGGLWIRDFNALEWRRLPGTEGATTPFWSPDSRHLAFTAERQLMKIDISGGPPQMLCAAPDSDALGDWNRDGVIILGSSGINAGGPLWKVSQTGGVATAITDVDTAKGELFHWAPAFLPDGKHYLYLRSGAPEVAGIYVGSLEANPKDQSRQRILATRSPVSYANGYLFFMRDGTLMAQAFEAERLQLSGEPVPVAEGVDSTWFNLGVFSVSPGGVLAYRARNSRGTRQFTWFDRQGKILSTFGQPGTDASVRLSPDGTRGVVNDAAFKAVDDFWSAGDLWTFDVTSGQRTRFTFRQSGVSPGVWSPDGRRIAFAAGNDLDTIYDKLSSGAGDERELLKEPGIGHYPTSWSSDGRFLLYNTTNTPKTKDDIRILPVKDGAPGERKSVLLLGTDFNEWGARFSPDMQWIAYVSNETRDREIFVRPFLASGPSGTPALGEGKWQVTKDGGNFPRWRADGKAIIYDDQPSAYVKTVVEVKASSGVIEFGTPQRLFTGPIDFGAWDVTPDGNRFLSSAPQVQQSALSITVVLNWPALLKK
jgi:Tol biopolymer transport system component/predicted Ser/Thr protein kinase